MLKPSINTIASDVNQTKMLTSVSNKQIDQILACYDDCQ
ncbi:hypothetical protein GPLA_2736 [Paraglaciecola polaris LMG 21857]|uniref:Uncharacterized protein n=1 Tax=Paraglaciecola polaris LMG 21857 TaxID=1129793 RepID=K7AE73_9ALTE|nr:hypothetical protein GPLA_2736 [Paraglaciecola polaris LMG 21857]